KDAEALERAHEVTMIVFDKTGTLTVGQPRVLAIVAAPGYSEADVLRRGAIAQQGSEHPLARAVLERAGQEGLVPLEQFKALPGRGIEAGAEGRRIRVGPARLMEESGIDVAVLRDKVRQLTAVGHTVMYVAEEGALLGAITAGDTVRPEARAAIRHLRHLGI